MGKLTFNTAALALIIGSSVAACNRGGPAPDRLTVAQLARLLESDRPPKLFDANGSSTREEYGVIPGAVLLPNSGTYPLDVLPSDKKLPLVFYCASTWCGAAESAARRAMGAGYDSVSVLPEGIKGWARAGKPVARARPRG